jgi:RNA polymerase-interacting CarD/CdnL/TRCF family regulator
MFNIGDQVVHKTHGAGVVTGLEERTIEGEVLQFVRVRLTIQEGDILIPLQNGITPDLRKAVTEEGIKELEEILAGHKYVVENMDKENPINPQVLIDSNDPFQIAQAIRLLTELVKEEDAEASYKEILSNARMKLTSELMLIKGITKASALAFINRSIHGTEKFMRAAQKRRKKIAKSKGQS